MKIRFTRPASKDYLYWKEHDIRKLNRIDKLCLDIVKRPFAGIGKPEPLKYDLQRYWSRRIDHKHRIVYRVKNNQVVIYSCRYHYHRSYSQINIK